MKKLFNYYLGAFFLGIPLTMAISSKVYKTRLVYLIYGQEVTHFRLMTDVLCVIFFYPLLKFIFSLFIPAKKRKKRINNPAKIGDYTLQFHTSKGTHLTVDNPFRGIYIQGGAGSGKSASFFEPIIKQFAQQNYTGIIYDFKSPELSSIAYAYYRNNPLISFKFVDFKDITLSNRVNPVSPAVLKKTAYAYEIAQAFIYNLLPENIKNQDFFSRSTITLMTGIIWFFKRNAPNICTLPHIITFILQCPAVNLVQIISSDNECAGMIASLKEAVDQQASKQIAGVLGTLKNAVSPLNLKEVFYILSEDEINLELNNPSNPTLLCIGNDSSLSSTYNAIISSIITISTKLMNQPGKLKSTVLLDEAPTVYIPNFEQLPATARSNKVSVVYSAQDFTQIVDRYGRDKAEALVANLGNQFFGRTTNTKTATMIRDIFGKYDRTMKSTSYGRSNPDSFLESGSSSSNTSYNIQERFLVPIREIKNASPGQFYALVAEGNYKEWIGTIMQRQEIEKMRPCVRNKKPNVDQVFNKIHEDISRLIENPKEFLLNASISIEIEIKEKVKSEDILDDFFDEL